MRARELLGSKDKTVRDRAILCLERIGYVLKDQETADALLQHAATAQSRYEIATALDALSRCQPPQPLAAEPLIELVRRPQWLVWQAAVRCLHLARPGEVEPVLLEKLDAEPIGLAYVARELRYMRSKESLIALEDLLGHKTLDVRCVALDSLGDRLGDGVLPFARRLAGGRTRQEKWWAEKWIAEHGTVDDIPFMASRVTRLLAKGDLSRYEPPEVSFLVPFLLRHESQPAAAKALDAIRRRHDYLPVNEREWIEKNAPALVAG